MSINSINTKFRWALRNKNTGTFKGSKATRSEARMAKARLGGNYGIFDVATLRYVR